jgi:hypothetical protein
MASPRKVKLGPGSLRVAVLDSQEPTSVSGAWPSAWQELGYTDAGSTFSYSITSEDVTVEEEIFPIDQVITGAAGSLTFALAEQTAENLLIALNAGLAADRAANTTDTSGDNTWVEPPTPREVKHIMVGWYALDAAGKGDAFGRIVARKCLQVGDISISRRKGATKATYSCTFSFSKPDNAQPFRAFFPNNLAA